MLRIRGGHEVSNYNTAAAFETHKIVVEGYRKKQLIKKIVSPKIRLISLLHSPKLIHSFVPSK